MPHSPDASQMKYDKIKCLPMLVDIQIDCQVGSFDKENHGIMMVKSTHVEIFRALRAHVSTKCNPMILINEKILS